MPSTKVIGGKKSGNPKNWFGPFLSPICSYRPEKKHSIGKMKFCIGLSLVLKLLVGKRVWTSCFQSENWFWPVLSPFSSCPIDWLSKLARSSSAPLSNHYFTHHTCKTLILRGFGGNFSVITGQGLAPIVTQFFKDSLTLMKKFSSPSWDRTRAALKK